MIPSLAADTIIAAHRGAWEYVPENSHAAVEAAIRLGADMVEIDVRRTLDGELVAHHDAMAGAMPVAALTLAELSEWMGYRPATVAEIVKLGAGRTWFDIELKEARYEEEVLQTVRSFLDEGSFIVTSFLPDAIMAAKRYGALTGLLFESALSDDTLEQCEPNILLPEVELVDETILLMAAQAGMPVVVWTVNQADYMRRFLQDPRVTGIITDHIDVALKTRCEIAHHGVRVPGFRSAHVSARLGIRQAVS